MAGILSEEQQQALEATRSVVKATMRSCRTCLSFLADIDRQLSEVAGAAADAEPQEAERDDYSREDRAAAG